MKQLYKHEDVCGDKMSIEYRQMDKIKTRPCKKESKGLYEFQLHVLDKKLKYLDHGETKWEEGTCKGASSCTIKERKYVQENGRV